MSIVGAKLVKTLGTASSDEELLRECLNGDEQAWCWLIDKYKNLVFSLPIKYGLSRDDAGDIFRSVWLELLSQVRALQKWLIQVTAHKCTRVQDRNKFEDFEKEHLETAARSPDSHDGLDEVEQEQILREAIWSLTPRCARMIRMLFLEFPPRRYDEIAREPGLATGSVGFIRGRCLDHLKQKLFSRGWR